jgi:hypothetical protein
VHLI